MAENKSLSIFGFEIKRKSNKEVEQKKLVSIVPPVDDDGAGYVTASNHFGYYVDLNGDTDAKDNFQLVRKYRGLSQHPEVDTAIEEIVGETIITGDNTKVVELVLDELEAPESIKKKMVEEFENIYNMLNFNNHGHDIFKSWYIDGRLYHHLVVNETNPKMGIQEIRHIDACKIRKVKQVEYKKDQATNAQVINKINEFFIFQEKPGNQAKGVRLSLDSVSYVTSGLLDESKRRVVSYLHKAIKPINQLRMMEDSLVIYRLARAPERRIFYIDVGNLPRGKAEEYMKSIMSRYRNKLVYDANTGELKDDRKHMSMLEDFWLPRKEGGRGTEISTLPGGDNLGQIDDIIYFQKRVYRSLNVPVSRLEQENTFNIGRSTEITREEVKFQKFIDRLRVKFSKLFLDILRKQLILKGIVTEEDWREYKENLFVDFQKDNHYTELKELEIIRERLGSLDQISQYTGTYFSQKWIMKNVLKFSEEDIKEMKVEIDSEPSGDDDREKDTPDSSRVENQPPEEPTNDSEDKE